MEPMNKRDNDTVKKVYSPGTCHIWQVKNINNDVKQQMNFFVFHTYMYTQLISKSKQKINFKLIIVSISHHIIH